MAISDYGSLVTAVSNWLHRSDLAAQVPDFITLAELQMNSDIDSRAMESRTILTTTAGNEYITLPTDMMEMRRLLLQTSPTVTLKYVTPDEISSDYATGRTDQPRVFAVIGGQVQLAPIPDAAYTIELTYKQRIPPLSASSTTNWLITAWPNAYLYGALLAAQPYIVNDARLPTFEAMYRKAIDGINSIEWYSGSTMRVRAG